MVRRLSVAVITTAAAASLVAAALPVGAVGASRHGAHHGTHVRAFDLRLLARSNHARARHHTQSYSMNHKLWNVAHAWAEHMARTGRLEHNPQLEAKLSRKCPQWRNIGENIGFGVNRSNKQMFRTYMRSPEHRANILNKHFRQVGIASVTLVRHHQVQEWNVMDFGDHC